MKFNFYLRQIKGTDFWDIKKKWLLVGKCRIMLAVKAIAQYSKLPTLIFDEIDTGVSGELPLKWVRL
jgi:DNA repair protein RecN (Recombination protein N)